MRQGKRRWVVVAIAAAIFAVTAIAAVLVDRSMATCPSATSPLASFANESQLPRLCELGAQSRLIGSGRVKGVSWRVVVTPPRPWSAYQAAGFSLPANMSGREGSCTVEVVSRPRGYFSDSCGQWNPLGPVQNGHFLGGACDRQVILVCDVSLERHADYFIVVLSDGSKLRLSSVRFRGRFFTAFAVPARRPARSLAAYDSRGRQLANGGSFLTG